MTVNLPPELDRYVQDRLQAGDYASADALIAHALQVLRQVEESAPSAREDLRRELEIGLRDIEEGRVSDWNLAEMEELVRRSAREKKAV